MPIELEYQGPTADEPGKRFWETARSGICLVLGVLVPVSSLIICGGDWPGQIYLQRENAQNRALISAASWLLSGQVHWPLYPALLFSVGCLGFCCLSQKQAAHFWVVRLGVYSGIPTAFLFGLVYAFDASQSGADSGELHLGEVTSYCVLGVLAAVIIVVFLNKIERASCEIQSRPLWTTMNVLLFLFCICLVFPGGLAAVLLAPATTLFAFLWMSSSLWTQFVVAAPKNPARRVWAAIWLAQIIGWTWAIHNAMGHFQHEKTWSEGG